MSENEWNSFLISENYSFESKSISDFGNLVKSMCCTVAAPKTITQIESLIHSANKNFLPMTLRGKGSSQSGQSVTPEGALSVDLSGMKNIDAVNLQNFSVRCEGGVTWRELLQKIMPYGVIPPVLPLYLDLTIAGTLSVGGVGASSHRYGPAVHHVLALDVITGSGQRVTCSPDCESDLFYAALAGLGRCSVILSVTLSLRKFKPRVRTFYLLYTDPKTWLADQQAIVEADRADYLEAFCSASLQGLRHTANGRKPFAQWFYPMQISFEYDSEAELDNVHLLRDLHHWKLTHMEDANTVDYVNRYAPRFEFMRKSGAWDLPHPWTECLVPGDVMPTLLPHLLEQIPLSMGDGHRVLFLAKPKNNNSLFMYPANTDKNAVLFAVLPTGIPSIALQESLEAMHKVNTLLIAAGGKRYLSGWLPVTDWQKHYGDRYAIWKANKETFDPNNVLRSLLFP